MLSCSMANCNSTSAAGRGPLSRYRYASSLMSNPMPMQQRQLHLALLSRDHGEPAEKEAVPASGCPIHVLVAPPMSIAGMPIIIIMDGSTPSMPMPMPMPNMEGSIPNEGSIIIMLIMSCCCCSCCVANSVAAMSAARVSNSAVVAATDLPFNLFEASAMTCAACS
jgi:hypothetical protein